MREFPARRTFFSELRDARAEGWSHCGRKTHSRSEARSSAYFAPRAAFLFGTPPAAVHAQKVAFTRTSRFAPGRDSRAPKIGTTLDELNASRATKVRSDVTGESSRDFNEGTVGRPTNPRAAEAGSPWPRFTSQRAPEARKDISCSALRPRNAVRAKRSAPSTLSSSEAPSPVDPELRPRGGSTSISRRAHARTHTPPRALVATHGSPAHARDLRAGLPALALHPTARAPRSERMTPSTEVSAGRARRANVPEQSGRQTPSEAFSPESRRGPSGPSLPSPAWRARARRRGGYALARANDAHRSSALYPREAD